MNALNINRHSLTLGFVHKIFPTVGVQVSRDDVTDLDFATIQQFDNGVVPASGTDLDSKEAFARIHKHYSSIHVDTSNV